MKIYSNELDIRDKLQNSRISFASQVKRTTLEEVIARFGINSDGTSAELAKKWIDDFIARHETPKAVATNLDQPDLYYMDSVLVSVGINKNDDYFDAEEVWAARKSPEDKQINYEHNEKDIIGHITSCYAVDDKYTKIPDDVPEDRLPEKFHIITSGVLYKKWEDEDLKKRMGEILEKIDAGDIYVSMECLFSDFDYILIEQNGKASIVDRNKSTSYLTKYLRAYGGEGVYNNQRIGRVIRNITFSGKGMVERPANPESIIFNSTSPVVIKAKEEINGENRTMSTKLDTEVTDVKANAELQNQLNEVTQLLADAKREKIEAKAQAEKEAKARAEKELNDLKASLAQKDTELKSVEAKLVDAEKSLEASVKKIEDAEKAAKAAQDELDKISAAKKVADRVAALVKAGKSEEDAKTLEKRFAKVDDEAFAALVENLVVPTEEDDEDDDEDKTVADKKDLENVETTKTQAGAKGKEAQTKLDETFKTMAGLFAKSSKVAKSQKTKSDE